MKKICFVATTSITLKTFLVDTAIYLHNHGDYEITFICDHDERFAESLPEYITFLPVSMSRGIDLRVLRAVLEFIRIFRRQNFDIVQFCTPNASLYASIAAKIARVPVRLYCQWGIRYVGFSGLKRTVFKALEKCVCWNATAIRAVSPMNKAFAVSEGLYPDHKVKVLGRGGTIGVDLAEYPLEKKAQWRAEIRQRYGIRGDWVFGFSGRLSRDKGGNELLSAFKSIHSQVQNAALLIVGPDEAGKDIDPDLLAWARQCEQIVFTGLVSKEEMPRHYAAMDVLVHPTYREGFGMVLQEAAAMEVAVLTTRIPGASEVLVDGESCLLCMPRNTEDLQNHMLKLCDPLLADPLAKSARGFVCNHYDRNSMLRRQFEDYEGL